MSLRFTVIKFLKKKRKQKKNSNVIRTDNHLICKFIIRNHLVRLLIKWLWVWITLLSHKLQIWRLPRARSSLTVRQTIECGFTLKLVRDVITQSKIQSYHFQFLICCYLNVLELITPVSKVFEEEELMPYEVRPIINETILNLNYAIQCDVDEDMLTSYLASFKVGDGSVITTVIQVEPLQMTFVQKESCEVSISEKKKVKI